MYSYIIAGIDSRLKASKLVSFRTKYSGIFLLIFIFLAHQFAAQHKNLKNIYISDVEEIYNFKKKCLKIYKRNFRDHPKRFPPLSKHSLASVMKI